MSKKNTPLKVFIFLILFLGAMFPYGPAAYASTQTRVSIKPLPVILAMLTGSQILNDCIDHSLLCNISCQSDVRGKKLPVCKVKVTFDQTLIEENFLEPIDSCIDKQNVPDTFFCKGLYSLKLHLLEKVSMINCLEVEEVYAFECHNDDLQCHEKAKRYQFCIEDDFYPR